MRDKTVMHELLQRVWARWKDIAHSIGNFQARLLLSVFYVIICPIFALIVKGKDPLQLHTRNRGSFWSERPRDEDATTLARRQF